MRSDKDKISTTLGESLTFAANERPKKSKLLENHWRQALPVSNDCPTSFIGLAPGFLAHRSSFTADDADIIGKKFCRLFPIQNVSENANGMDHISAP